MWMAMTLWLISSRRILSIHVEVSFLCRTKRKGVLGVSHTAEPSTKTSSIIATFFIWLFIFSSIQVLLSHVRCTTTKEVRQGFSVQRCHPLCQQPDLLAFHPRPPAVCIIDNRVDVALPLLDVFRCWSGDWSTEELHETLILARESCYSQRQVFLLVFMRSSSHSHCSLLVVLYL